MAMDQRATPASLLDALPCAAAMLSPRDPGSDPTILSTNAAWRALIGPAGAEGRGLSAVVPEIADPRTRALLDAALAGGAPWRARAGAATLLAFAEDGVPVVIALPAAAAPNADPAAGAAALRERLALATEMNGVGVWEWRADDDRMLWSEGMHALFGLAPGSFGGTLEAFLALLHPQDAARIMDRVYEGARSDDAFSYRFRVLLPDGGERPIAARARVLERAADGAPVRIAGVNQDACAETAARDRAILAERRLADAVEALPDAFVLYDSEDRLVACNSRYRALYDRSVGAILPGASFESIVRAGLAEGQYPQALGREAAFLADRLALHARAEGSEEQALPGDRWVRIIERRTGSGDTVGFRIDVTDFKRQERALREATARAEAAATKAAQAGAQLERFFDLSLDLLGIADPEGRFLKLNAAWERTLGWPRARLLGASFERFVHPEDLESTRASRDAAVDGHPVDCFINRFRTVSGEYLTLEWRAARAEDGCIHFAARDVTAREAEMRRRAVRAAEEAALSGLMRLALDGGASGDFAPAALGLLLDAAAGGGAAPGGALFLFPDGPDGPATRLAAARGLDPDRAAEIAAAVAARVGGRADAACTVASCAGPVCDPGLCLLPLLHAGRTLGTIAVLSRDAGGDPWTDAAFLRRAADAVALGLANRAEMARAEDERRRACAALEELEAYQAALDAHAIVSVTDGNGVIQSVNRNFCRISGYEAEALIGRTHRIVNSGHHPPEFFAEMWATIRDGRPWRGEICNRHREGGLYWVDATVIPVRDGEGRIVRFVAVRYDITERRRLADEIAAANRRLRHVAEVSGVGGWDYDIATGALLWDDVTCALHEVPPDHAVTIDMAVAHYLPEARGAVRAAFDACLADGTPFDVEAPLLTAAGRRIWVRAVGAAVLEHGRVARIAGSVQDVTDRRARAAEADALRARFEAIFENTDQVMFLKRRDGRFSAGNRQFRAQVGADDVAGRTDRDFAPADIADRFAATEAAVFASGEPVMIEETVVRPDGRRQHYVSSKFLIPDAVEGDDILCAVATDVTELREREAEASRMRARFEAIFENTDAHVFLKRRDGTYVTANRRLLARLGRETIEGLTAFDLFPPEQAARFVEQDAMAFAADRPLVFEQTTTHPDGSTGAYLLSLVAVRAEGESVDLLCGMATDITELREREAEAARMTARLEAIFERSAATIYLKRRDGTYIAGNAHLAAQLGGPFVGRRNADFLPAAEAAVFTARDDAVFATGEATTIEEVARGDDGAPRDFLTARFLIDDAVLGEKVLCVISTDISGQKRREAEIEGLRARFEAFFENSDAVMYIKDRDGRHLRANAKCRAGFPADGVVGRTVAETWDADSAARIAAVDRAVFETGAPFTGEETLRLPSGEAVSYLSSKFLIDDPSVGAQVLCGISTDITPLKRLQASLERSRRAAEDASRAKSHFLATMSHEIRTPMNGVIGMAQLLARLVHDPEQRRMLDVIRDSGGVLLNVINDILDFSKIEAGKLDIEAAPVSLAEVARRIEAVHTLKAAEKGLSFSVLTSAGCAAPRLGDAHRIQQVLHNLVSNAIKFTESGEVCVTLRCGPGAPVQIEVRDSGPGMTPEQAARVFEPFAQADSSTTRRYGGTGLGLPIVKSLVEAMGGTLALDTAPGAGTTARVRLPLPETEGAGPAAAAEAAEADIPPGLRVLAADDNEVNRMVLGAFLDSLGVAHAIAEGGREAVAAARAGGYDLLMLDISMPGMDGIEALAAIRAEEAARGAPHVPAMAVTANAMTHQIEEFLAAGFDAHLAKPIRREELVERLIRLGRKADGWGADGGGGDGWGAGGRIAPGGGNP